MHGRFVDSNVPDAHHSRPVSSPVARLSTSYLKNDALNSFVVGCTVRRVRAVGREQAVAFDRRAKEIDVSVDVDRVVGRPERRESRRREINQVGRAGVRMRVRLREDGQRQEIRREVPNGRARGPRLGCECDGRGGAHRYDLAEVDLEIGWHAVREGRE